MYGSCAGFSLSASELLGYFSAIFFAFLFYFQGVWRSFKKEQQIEVVSIVVEFADSVHRNGRLSYRG